MRHYWSGSSASSLCTFLLTENPSAGFAQGHHSGRSTSRVGFLEFTQFFNHGFPWKLQSCVKFSMAISAYAVSGQPGSDTHVDQNKSASPPSGHASYSRLLCRLSYRGSLLSCTEVQLDLVAKGARGVKRVLVSH
jgi:hypothetical protein